MKILVTNDDGIRADGIIRLAKAAKKYGDVIVCAPDEQKSGASHSINLQTPIPVKEVSFPVEGVRAYAISGSPSDCVRVSVRGFLSEEEMPDVVLSGINNGYNAGTDVQYSGTIGAAMEAEFQGIKAIAFSEGFGDNHSVTDKYLESILGQAIEKKIGDDEIINVNFPTCEIEELKGILWDRTVSEGFFYKDHYNKQILEDGTVAYMVEGVLTHQAEEGSDLRALADNYISIGIVKNIG